MQQAFLKRSDIMTVYLMSTTDDPRVVTKTRTIITTVDAKPTENCTILNPRLILNYSSALAEVNYMYIPSFGRYYFIDNIIVNPGATLTLSGTVDVLTTYDNHIRNCEGTIIRSESIGKPTIYPDSKLPIEPNRYAVTSIVLQNSLNNVTAFSEPYLLIVRG